MSGAASLDLRLPIGGLFTVLGVVIGAYGLATKGSAIYETSLNININLWWGLVLLAFGASMILLGRRRRRS